MTLSFLGKWNISSKKAIILIFCSNITLLLNKVAFLSKLNRSYRPMSPLLKISKSSYIQDSDEFFNETKEGCSKSYEKL